MIWFQRKGHRGKGEADCDDEVVAASGVMVGTTANCDGSSGLVCVPSLTTDRRHLNKYLIKAVLIPTKSLSKLRFVRGNFKKIHTWRNVTLPVTLT